MSTSAERTPEETGMRWFTKASAVLVTLALAVVLASCSSDPGGSNTTDGSQKPVGAFKKLDGASTTVIFAKGFVAALGRLKLMGSPVGKAKFKAGGGRPRAIFPITGGNATIYQKGAVDPYVQGEIEHEGSGLRLSAGKTTFTMENFVVHPGSHATLTGDVVVDGGVPLRQVVLFDLDGSTLRKPTISKSGVAKLAGTTIYLAEEGAEALNGVFGTDVLAGDRAIKVGNAVIRATGS